MVKYYPAQSNGNYFKKYEIRILFLTNQDSMESTSFFLWLIIQDHLKFMVFWTLQPSQSAGSDE